MAAEDHMNRSAMEEGFYSMKPKDDLDSLYTSGRLPKILKRTLEGPFSWQRRNETTLERTLNMPGLAPQWVAGLLAGGAMVHLSGKDIPLVEVLQMSTKQSFQDVRLPVDGLCWGAAQVARTPGDEPIVFAIATVKMSKGVVWQAQAALTGVWPSSVGMINAANALAGGPLTVERIAEVAAKVADEVDPRGDFLGSADYRRAMSVVLTRHALEMCLEGMN